jgi:hypothetical protein
MSLYPGLSRVEILHRIPYDELMVMVAQGLRREYDDFHLQARLAGAEIPYEPPPLPFEGTFKDLPEPAPGQRGQVRRQMSAREQSALSRMRALQAKANSLIAD